MVNIRDIEMAESVDEVMENQSNSKEDVLNEKETEKIMVVDNNGEEEEENEYEEDGDSEGEDEEHEEDGDSEREDDGDSEDEGHIGRHDSNAGWADAMKKILSVQKPQKKKTIVLSKAKRLSLMKVKKEETGENEDNCDKPEVHQMEKKKNLIVRGRSKPNVLDKNKERTLAKIATRGIVHLFNAVNTHKKSDTVKEEKSESLRKKAHLSQVNKKSFLNMLMGENEAGIKTEDESDDDFEPEVKDETATCWEVLKENFLMSERNKEK